MSRTILAPFCLALALFAQAPAFEEQIWKSFHEWSKTQAAENSAALLKSYRAKVIADGLTEQQAEERLALIHKLAAAHPTDAVAAHFDRIYTGRIHNPDGKLVFETRPNAFLVAKSRDLRPGAALDVTMGEGRNTIFLAQKGWDATGFDVAEEGLAIARANAAKAGLKINTVRQRYEEFDFGKEKWDLVVCSYAWVPIAEPAFVEKVRDSLRPGGWILIEHPADDPGKKDFNSAANAVNGLLKAYAGFRIVYEDTQDVSDWQRTRDDRLQTKGRIVRLFAQKI